MICPTCKSHLVVIEHNNIELDWCYNCHGVWFDSTELGLLLKSMNLDGRGLIPEDISSSPEAKSAEKKRKCPRCGRSMKKTDIGDKPKILIDLCRRGHGLWFDGDELAQLLIEAAGKKVGNQPEVISFLAEVFKAPTA